MTHNQPAQVLRLVRALNALYADPPIVIHHDWDKCRLDGLECAENVTFVRPHVATDWGAYNLVLAEIAGLRVFTGLREPPEWITLLSGSDYPARPAREVLDEIRLSNADALLDFEEIDPRRLKRAWQKDCAQRYFCFYVPVPRRTPHGFRMAHETVRNGWLQWIFSPYSRKFRCYAGSQWFTARTEIAAKLLEWHDRNPWLGKHLEDRWCTDETFTQTVLCNLPGVRLSRGNRRYVDWSEEKAHPRRLGIGDLPAIAASGAHFARKFECGEPALDELDRVLGIRP